jgi:hypothetical protein
MGVNVLRAGGPDGIVITPGAKSMPRKTRHGAGGRFDKPLSPG